MNSGTMTLILLLLNVSLFTSGHFWTYFENDYTEFTYSLGPKEAKEIFIHLILNYLAYKIAVDPYNNLGTSGNQDILGLTSSIIEIQPNPKYYLNIMTNETDKNLVHQDLMRAYAIHKLEPQFTLNEIFLNIIKNQMPRLDLIIIIKNLIEEINLLKDFLFIYKESIYDAITNQIIYIDTSEALEQGNYQNLIKENIENLSNAELKRIYTLLKLLKANLDKDGDSNTPGYIPEFQRDLSKFYD